MGKPLKNCFRESKCLFCETTERLLLVTPHDSRLRTPPIPAESSAKAVSQNTNTAYTPTPFGHKTAAPFSDALRPDSGGTCTRRCLPMLCTPTKKPTVETQWVFFLKPSTGLRQRQIRSCAADRSRNHCWTWCHCHRQQSQLRRPMPRCG